MIHFNDTTEFREGVHIKGVVNINIAINPSFNVKDEEHVQYKSDSFPHWIFLMSRLGSIPYFTLVHFLCRI